MRSHNKKFLNKVFNLFNKKFLNKVSKILAEDNKVFNFQ